MTAKAGRKAVIYYKETGDTEWTLPAGAREKSFSFNNAAVDITSDDDNGWKTSLDDTSATRDWSLKLTGVSKDSTLVNRALQETSLEVAFAFNDAFYYTGKARITSAEQTAGQEDPVTYDVAFEGSGALTQHSGLFDPTP